ncbi:hypothetical protein GWK47_017126 [Chionoecetes opilio]|uniref:Uncharacterized protein n=1 Tax=Chionoecetes opilio TaxID=41210 RepID=A0A8J4XSV2_CHIOP|nr:hypothetical protein GWK47_017126 [Chionoecetes opilio]
MESSGPPFSQRAVCVGVPAPRRTRVPTAQGQVRPPRVSGPPPALSADPRTPLETAAINDTSAAASQPLGYRQPRTRGPGVATADGRMDPLQPPLNPGGSPLGTPHSNTFGATPSPTAPSARGPAPPQSNQTRALRGFGTGEKPFEPLAVETPGLLGPRSPSSSLKMGRGPITPTDGGENGNLLDQGAGSLP